MDCPLLIRPGVTKKSTNDANEKILPADLAAAYACYHKNLLEHRELEQKLQVIDIETKEMKRNCRRQREILERELKKNENDYWSCHRVFSAESLITESDLSKKLFYTGPQPTKAKFPRRTLERLSQLLRSLKAEDDLETLLRFQRCTRYARRKQIFGNKSVSSLTLSQGSSTEFDSWELQPVTELPSGSPTDSVGRLSRNTSGREKRIRSAPPVRVASGKMKQRDWNERRHSECPRQYSPEKLNESSKYLTSKAQESSGITYFAVREKPSIRFAWVEKEKLDDRVNDVIHDAPSATGLEQSRDVDLGQTSPQWSGYQSRDTGLLPTSSEHGISPSSVSKDSASNREQLRTESSSFEHLQRREAEVAELDFSKHKHSFSCQEKSYVESSAVEEQRKEDENSDRIDSENTKGTTTPSKGWAFVIKSVYVDEQDSSAPNSRSAFQNEDLAHASEKRGKGHDINLSESDDECSSMKHVEFQDSGNEMQQKREEENRQVTANNTRDLALCDNKSSKTSVFHHGADQVAQRKGGRKMTIALPKSSLHGLSSFRKSLSPRTQHKPLQKNPRASRKAQTEQEVTNNSVKRNPHVKTLPEDSVKMPQEEKQLKDVRKKRKGFIFKRTCLSKALFSGQAQVESQLRNRVQGFLGTVDNVDETSERETGEEELQ